MDSAATNRSLAVPQPGLFAAAMLFALKKFVSFWLMPYSFCIVAILAGLWFWRTGRRVRLGRALTMGGLLLLLVASNHYVARGLARPLEIQYAPIPELPAGAPVPADLDACRFVVILGAGNAHIPDASALAEVSGSALARLAEGVRLLRVLPEAKLIVSGPSDGKRESHGAKLARAAVSLGVDPARIIVIDQARDTEEESREVHARTGHAPLALVTSAWHMPRAIGLFRKLGAKPLPCPVDYITAPDDPFYFTHLLWEPAALGCTSIALRERIGQLWNWMRGKS